MVASNRYQQVSLAYCWVSVVSHLCSYTTDTCLFLHVIAQTTKIPVIIWVYPGGVNSKLALPLYVRGGHRSFKCFRYCGQIHGAGFLLLGGNKDWVFPHRSITITTSCCSYSVSSITLRQALYQMLSYLTHGIHTTVL